MTTQSIQKTFSLQICFMFMSIGILIGSIASSTYLYYSYEGQAADAYMRGRNSGFDAGYFSGKSDVNRPYATGQGYEEFIDIMTREQKSSIK